jgi:hypothetical protein
MSETKYCRLRHKETSAEAELVEDYMDDTHIIRHFYAVDGGPLSEINRQPCNYEPAFELMWKDTVNGYKLLGWEVVE